MASANNATVQAPGSKVLAKTGSNLYESTQSGAGMDGGTIVGTGGGQNHINMMPSLCVNFIIALVGIYPSRQ
jgi:microcystin-dependent protein